MSDTQYKSVEEVERYKSRPLMERLKDRTGIMKCVPLTVADTIIEATAEIERLRADLDEARGAARRCYSEGRFGGTISEAAFLEKWPWLKEEE